MGGLSSFERFCADAHPQLMAALAHLTGEPALAEELAQEALVRAGDRWEHVSRMQSPVGWAFRVGANLSRSVVRRRLAERRAYERHGAPTDHVDVDTADQLTVRAALQGLGHRQREVVVLRYYIGLSAEETAAVIGSTAGAVRATTHRAVTHLRELLGPSGLEEEVAHDAQ